MQFLTWTKQGRTCWSLCKQNKFMRNCAWSKVEQGDHRSPLWSRPLIYCVRVWRQHACSSPWGFLKKSSIIKMMKMYSVNWFLQWFSKFSVIFSNNIWRHPPHMSPELRICLPCTLIKSTQIALHHMRHNLDPLRAGLKCSVLSVPKLSGAPGACQRKHQARNMKIDPI